jgi:large subunit ribosomal protein L3
VVTGIIGKKIGMTQIFAEDGTVLSGTVIKAGPCVVIQQKTVERDGYQAVQLGFVEEKPARANKALAGHYKHAKVPPTRVLREVALDDEDGSLPNEGEQVLVSLFETGEQVDVIGVSRGRGFQGVMKRHGFSGGGATHGSMFHRAPGSIGQSSYPSRVFKGMRGPGRMGGDRITTRNLSVIHVDLENHQLVVRGSVPGAPGGYLVIRKAVAPRKRSAPEPTDGPKKKSK